MLYQVNWLGTVFICDL